MGGLLSRDGVHVWGPPTSSVRHTGFPNASKKSQVCKSFQSKASCGRILFLQETWRVLLGPVTCGGGIPTFVPRLPTGVPERVSLRTMVTKRFLKPLSFLWSLLLVSPSDLISSCGWGSLKHSGKENLYLVEYYLQPPNRFPHWACQFCVSCGFWFHLGESWVNPGSLLLPAWVTVGQGPQDTLELHCFFSPEVLNQLTVLLSEISPMALLYGLNMSP